MDALTIITIDKHPLRLDSSATRMTPARYADAIWKVKAGYLPVAFNGFTIRGTCPTLRGAFDVLLEIKAMTARSIN